MEAVATALPTEGSHELIRTWHASDRPIAIVSNNSVEAINTYLDLYDLRTSIDVVSARTSSDAALLKPNPYLLHQAITTLGTTPNDCVFIGDSLNDIEAAHAARVPFVGYANKPGKTSLFTAANAVIKKMTTLTKTIIVCLCVEGADLESVRTLASRQTKPAQPLSQLHKGLVR